MDIAQEQAAFRREAQVSSNCLTCKGVTACTVGGKTFPGCILCRKPGACSGPYTDWRTFEREAEKEDES